MARAAVVQLNSKPDVNQNFLTLESFFAQATEQGAELILLPENFAWLGVDTTVRFNLAELEGKGEIQNKLSRLAKQYGIWIVAGTMPIKTVPPRVRASCFVFDHKGKQVARYDKVHLFDVRVTEQEFYQESASIEPGKKLVVVDTPVGRIGLSVCYDLRFPELYRELTLQGAEIFTIPSAFTETTGMAHWSTLLRARAIENLTYVLAANQTGTHEGNRKTYGHSMIIEPWGKIIGELQRDEGLVVSEIDLDHLRKLRQQFPCNDHHVLPASC